MDKMNNEKVDSYRIKDRTMGLAVGGDDMGEDDVREALKKNSEDTKGLISINICGFDGTIKGFFSGESQ